MTKPMIEARILTAVVLLGALLSIGPRSAWRGFGLAALWIFGALAALAALTWAWDKAVTRWKLEALEDAWASPPARAARAVLGCAALGVVYGALGLLLGAVIGPRLTAQPEGQILVLRALAGGGFVLGVAVSYYFKDRPTRF